MALAKKPITFKNKVQELTWNIPIVNKNGTPTEEFQRKWLQQAATNASIVNLTNAAGVSAVLDLITSVVGSLLVRGASQWQGLPPAGDATKFLNGAATPAYAKVKDSDLAVSDVTSNDVSITAHGFAPKAPNDATKFLDGTGAYSVPAGGAGTFASSIYDDGTTIYMALVDADGQVITDGAGLGIYAPEVFPASAVQGITGRTAGAAVAAGQVGQLIENEILVGAAVAVTTATPTDIGFIDLTAGVWFVWGNVEADLAGGASGTSFAAWVHTVSATVPTRPNKGAIAIAQLAIPVNGVESWPLGAQYLNVSVTTRVYLETQLSFTGGTCSAFGYIGAVRVA